MLVVRFSKFVLPTVPPMTQPTLPLLLAFAAFTWTSQAMAHDLWIERADGGFVLRYGHHGGAVLPLQAEKVKTLSCRKDKGRAEDLRAKAATAPKQLGLKATCAAVSAFFDGGFYSLTPDGEKNLPKNQVPDAVKAWRSKQFAKWVDGKSPLAKEPQGDEFEIVPVTDLAKAKTGDKATFRVLLGGKPLAGAILAIDHKALGETDDQGEARVKIRATDVEQVSASLRRPSKSAEADSEVYEASLTFEVAR
jgi:nickel transport protein